jgi:hypothetical protein
VGRILADGLSINDLGAACDRVWRSDANEVRLPRDAKEAIFALIPGASSLDIESITK